MSKSPGVVGLACGKELAKKGYEVFIAEQEKSSQTSARNSGVIHAGIYYPSNSLKAKLCVRSKHLLYEYCNKNNSKNSRNNKYEMQILLKLKETAANNGVDLELISGQDAIDREPNLFAVSALLSPTTGIIDASELADLSYIKPNTWGQLSFRAKITK